MRTCVLAGGVGSARLVAGLTRVVDARDIAIVVNTGDDEHIRGLHVSPDVDTVLYHLASLTDWERGWGISDETFASNDRYRELAARAGTDLDLQEWFALGDRDLATHQLRTRLLDAGASLADATAAIARALGVSAAVIPMSNEAVRTVVEVAGRRVPFQEYFVRDAHAGDVTGIHFEGADDARPAPGVLDAIASADLLLIPPSNPLLSIAPILSIDGIADAIRARSGGRFAVSPIVAGRALKGPAAQVLQTMGYEASPAGVASVYDGLLDALVVDDADRDVTIAGLDVFATDTIMTGPESAARLCKEILNRAA